LRALASSPPARPTQRSPYALPPAHSLLPAPSGPVGPRLQIES